MMRPYLYSDFIKQNWNHVKDKPLSQTDLTPNANLQKFRRHLMDIGIESKEDMVDWRIYALIMFSIIARRRLKISTNWLPLRPNIIRAEECFSIWDSIKTEDIPQTFHNLRLCIEDKKLDLLSKIGLLLRSKYELHHNSKSSTYVPIYLSLYTKLLKNPRVLNKVVTNHRAWGVLSTIHYFPLGLAIAEYDGFEDENNWFMCSFLILSKLLDEDK